MQTYFVAHNVLLHQPFRKDKNFDTDRGLIPKLIIGDTELQLKKHQLAIQACVD